MEKLILFTIEVTGLLFGITTETLLEVSRSMIVRT